MFNLSIQDLNNYHCTSYITTTFTLASGHPGLSYSIDTILLYYIQCCSVQFSKKQPLVEDVCT